MLQGVAMELGKRPNGRVRLVLCVRLYYISSEVIITHAVIGKLNIAKSVMLAMLCEQR